MGKEMSVAVAHFSLDMFIPKSLRFSCNATNRNGCMLSQICHPDTRSHYVHMDPFGYPGDISHIIIVLDLFRSRYCGLFILCY